MNNPLLPTLCEIRRRHRDTADVFTLEIEPAAPHVTFTAGQFNMLYLPGAGEVPISLSGDPNDGTTLVHTIRPAGKVTGLLQEKQAGDQIGIRGPFGKGWPLHKARGRNLLIVAGGIGMAPLRPVLYEVRNNRRDYGDLALLYGARTPADILYSDQLMQWKRADMLRLFVSVDAAGDGDWSGDIGVITELVPRAIIDPPNTVALICGPEVMIRFTVNILRERGVSGENVYVSLERSMKCATGFCGHCQLGPYFLCKNGPVFPYSEIERYITLREF